MIYFISDLHFGHKRILELSDRPFKDVDEMNNALIKNWNETVRDDDTIYHIGDFCMNNRYTDLHKQLKGNIIFLRGNHDYKLRLPFETDSVLQVKWGKHRFFLCHYPIDTEWNRRNHGGYHIHGHVHENMPFNSAPGRYNVSADAIGLKPISVDHILHHAENSEWFEEFHKRPDE